MRNSSQDPTKAIVVGVFTIVSLLFFLWQVFSVSGAISFDLASFKNSSFAATIVGIGASIAPNEFNSLAEELQSRSQNITVREQELSLRESQLGIEYRNAIKNNNRVTLFALLAVTLVLVSLILLNFYLDYKRGKSLSEKGRSHSGELQTRI